MNKLLAEETVDKTAAAAPAAEVAMCEIHALVLFDMMVGEVLHAVDQRRQLAPGAGPLLAACGELVAALAQAHAGLFETVVVRSYVAHSLTWFEYAGEQIKAQTLAGLREDGAGAPAAEGSSSNVDLFDSMLDRLSRTWATESELAERLGIPGWAMRRLRQLFEKQVLAPLHDAALELASPSHPAGQSLQAALREFLVEASLLSPAATKGRNILMFLTGRVSGAEGSRQLLEADAGESPDEAAGAADDAANRNQRVEAIWRDILVDWVLGLLCAGDPRRSDPAAPASGRTGAQAFVETLAGALRRIR